MKVLSQMYVDLYLQGQRELAIAKIENDMKRVKDTLKKYRNNKCKY